MNTLLVAVLLASSGRPAGLPAEDDVRCYRAMAELARAEDPPARMLGLAAAQYFLGRIDAAAPGYDMASVAPVAVGDRAGLIRRCSEALRASGFYLRALGASLTPDAPAI